MFYLSLTFGLTRWPGSTEADARRRGLRVIVPVRAGYGHLGPLPRSRGHDAALLDDTFQVLQAEQGQRCPAVTLGGESCFAFRLAERFPDTVSALLCTGGMLPTAGHAVFERMGKRHRFIVAGAKYTPQLLPFVVKAGFAMFRGVGAQGFLEAIYGRSKADAEAIADPEILEALVTGSDITLSDGVSAHEAFARTMTGGMFEDWSNVVASVEGRCPVVVMNGLQDPQVAPETIEEMRRDYPWIDYRTYADAGQLVLFRHWRDALAILEGFTGR